jgi:hypothetical protein
MKKTSIITIILFSLISINTLYSQSISNGFSVSGTGYSSAILTDYQCVGLNPANLGWKRNEHLINFGIGQTNFAVYSEPLKRELVKELFNESDENFNQEEKDQAARLFTDSKLQFEGNISGMGFSFQDEKIGGFGLAIREKVMWNSTLSESIADILFKGYNASYFDSLTVNTEGDTIGWATVPQMASDILENTKISLVWYREYNFSYGHSIINTENISIYGGVGVKYLEGYNMFNFSYEEGGDYVAYTSINPAIGLTFGQSPSQVDNNRYQATGHGWGMDIGLSAFLYDHFRIAASVVDIGSIKWDKNVYVIKNDFVKNIQDEGMNSFNIFDLQNTEAFENLKWGGWEGVENVTTTLPMSVRTGVAYILKKKYEFGAEMYIPVNTDAPGAYDKLIAGGGVRAMPLKWFRVSAGVVSGANTGTSFPVGISFFPFNRSSFTWEIGFATNDMSTFFQQEKPTVSFAFGLFRFSFGHLGKGGTSESSNDTMSN